MAPKKFWPNCADAGIGIYSTGGETADVGDLVRTIIVDSTVTCRMKRSDVINNDTD
jgi:phosphoribosylformylglycinamidine cyclo-ligase